MEECAFAVSALARCQCRAPEESDSCNATWSGSGDEKVDLLASCYTGACKDACGL